MQALSRGQDGGHGDGRSAGHRHISQHRERTQAISAKGGDQTGGGDFVFRIGFAQREGQLRGQKCGQAKTQQQRAAVLAERGCQNRHDTAKKPGQRKSPHAGGAPARRFLAFAPMPFRAYQQSNGERGGQAV